MTEPPSPPVEERCACGHAEASHGIGHGAMCVECANAPVNGVARHHYRPSPHLGEQITRLVEEGRATYVPKDDLGGPLPTISPPAEGPCTYEWDIRGAIVVCEGGPDAPVHSHRNGHPYRPSPPAQVPDQPDARFIGDKYDFITYNGVWEMCRVCGEEQGGPNTPLVHAPRCAVLVAEAKLDEFGKDNLWLSLEREALQIKLEAAEATIAELRAAAIGACLNLVEADQPRLMDELHALATESSDGQAARSRAAGAG